MLLIHHEKIFYKSDDQQEKSVKPKQQTPQRDLNPDQINTEFSNKPKNMQISNAHTKQQFSKAYNLDKRNNNEEKKLKETQDVDGFDLAAFIKESGLKVVDKVVKMDCIRAKTILEIQKIASLLSVEHCCYHPKRELIFMVVKQMLIYDFQVIGSGIVEILRSGFAFLRAFEFNYLPGVDDVYISPTQVKKLGLKMGDYVQGEVSLPKKSERYLAMVKVCEINSINPKNISYRASFEDLIPWYPNQKLKLDCNIIIKNKKDLSTRITDMTCPIGFGQRALIVSPPKSGKTVLMQNISRAIEQNHPEVKLIVLLIDERPEEVTDMKRFVKGEVLSSTFDEPASRHVQLAEMVIEKAKRLVENNKNVVILLDSITRLARAYNTVEPSSGKVLTGGIDSNALHRPKRFFGAARNTETAGSLTIIATALVDTGSRMDDVIFEEFKGTGNSEIHLDRRLADRRMFPAIDILKSGTRREEMLMDEARLKKTWILRKILSQMSTVDALEFLSDKLQNVNDNEEFFNNMNKG